MLARTMLGIIIAMSAAGCGGAGSAGQIDLLVANGTVIDPASGSAGSLADIAIDDGRIIAVGEGIQDRYAAVRVIDATGEYIIPGLADMHTHFGTGVRPPDEDDTTPVLARLLFYGVTTTLNLGSFQAWPERIDSLRDAMGRGELQGPRLLAAGALITVPGSHPTTTIYSPPMQTRIAAVLDSAPPQGAVDLVPATARATTLVRNTEEMQTEVRRLGQWGADAIKLIVESGPAPFGDDHPRMTPELIRAAVEAAAPFGVPVLCHASSADELTDCLDQGAGGVAHAVMTDLPDGIEARMAAAGMALIPTASLFDGWARYSADPSLLDEPFLAATLTPAEREWLGSDAMTGLFVDRPAWDHERVNLMAHIKAAHDANVLIVAGTDVGNLYRFPGHSLHEELALYVAAGLTPAEALATATINAARLVGDENEWGAIRDGLAADLVILGADPLEDIRNTRTIRQVIRAGQVVDRATLPVQ